MIDLTSVIGDGQLFVDRGTHPDDAPLVYVGDGEKTLAELRPIGDPGPDMPPHNDQVYAALNGDWTQQALMDDMELPEREVAPVLPTAQDTIIGYVIGPNRGVNGADIHLCNWYGDIIETPAKSWFDSHAPWVDMVDYVDGVNAMVKVPRYWYRADKQPANKPLAGCPRFTIASFEIEGWECDGSVFKDHNGLFRDYFAIGKYRSRDTDGVPTSQSTGTPWPGAVGKTYEETEAAHSGVGTGWHLFSYQELCTILHLAIIENGTLKIPDSNYRGIQEFGVESDGIVAEWLSGLQVNSNNAAALLARDGSRSIVDTDVPILDSQGVGMNYILSINDAEPVANYFLATTTTLINHSLMPSVQTGRYLAGETPTNSRAIWWYGKGEA